MTSLPTGIAVGDSAHTSHHDIVHALLNSVDAPFEVASIDVDTLANLPAAGQAGRFFLDQLGRLLTDSGSAWLSVASGNVVKNITDPIYGAASGSDCTTAIQDAMDDCSAEGGGIVYGPVGNWKFTHLDQPANVILLGAGWGSHFECTGAGRGISIDPGTGTLTNWESQVRGIRLTTATATVGIYLKDVGEVDILDNYISGFSVAGIQSDPTAGQGVICVNIHRNKIKQNGAGIQVAGANAQFQWSILGNRIQGNTARPGLDFPQSIQGLEVAGNDIEGNAIAEVFFGNDVIGASIHGNYHENADPAAICYSFTGAGTARGVSIEGNSAANTGASSTGPFFYCTMSGTLSGFAVHANRVAGYGAGSFAFSGGGKTYMNSDFSGNDIDHANKFDAFGVTVLDKHEVLVSLDFGVVGAGATADLTAAVAGLPSAGIYSVVASPVGGFDGGFVAFGFVSAADTVTVRLQNSTGGGYNPGARLYMIAVTRHA